MKLKTEIIVLVIQLACIYTTIFIMDKSTWGLWSWQTLCVSVSLLVMGLVNFAHGFYKCDVVA